MDIKSQDSQFDGLQFYLNNYQYQPNFAFIKGYTTLIQCVNRATNFVKEIIEIITKIQISSTPYELQIILLILINKVLFSLAAYKIFNITFGLTSNAKLGYTITLLFIYNPACVFFHSVYTESIYAFLTFSSIDYLFKSHQKKTQKHNQMSQISTQFNTNYLKSLLFLWLSVFFRTNAIFLLPIFGIPLIYQLWLLIQSKCIIKITVTFIKGIFILTLILSPLAYYQNHIYKQLCQSQVDLQNDENLVVQCQKLLPNLYSFIQKKFWNVGFFSYWKLPNAVFILIGMPALFIGSSIFYRNFYLLKKEPQNQITMLHLTKIGVYFSFLILFIVTLTLTNIQSSTRFFSTHIAFYFLIYEWLDKKAMKFWIFLYYCFGAILFFIGFPWT